MICTQSVGLKVSNEMIPEKLKFKKINALKCE